MSKILTIGMATYDDYDGVYFTIQSLRLNHGLANNPNIEILVLDNNPTSKQGMKCKDFLKGIPNTTYIPYDKVASSFSKYELLKHAKGTYYLGLDCHVLLPNNFISDLLSYYHRNPNTKDLIQGPLLMDDLSTRFTHFDPVWRGNMYGTWGQNKLAYMVGEPFEIYMQGMGMFSCKTDQFPKIGDKFSAFGGEEGYIHEKFRQNGGKCLCHPKLDWVHRFSRPDGVPYKNTYENIIRNYIIGWYELSGDFDHAFLKQIRKHFSTIISPNKVNEVFSKTRMELVGPHYDLTHWDKLPSVSCQCITYGRPELLVEAIESFLQQDYAGDKELVILNDQPEVKYSCDAPGVRIINLDHRVETIGEKRNICVSHCKNDIIFPWDDDDISLPHRISFSLQEMKNHHYFKADCFWFMNGATIDPEPSHNVAHAMGAFSREIFNELGGYDHIQSGQDLTFENKISQRNLRDIRKLNKNDVYYIYRFGVTRSYHLSAWGYGNGYDESKKYVDSKKLSGEIKLLPLWRGDYTKLVNNLLPEGN